MFTISSISFNINEKRNRARDIFKLKLIIKKKKKLNFICLSHFIKLYLNYIQYIII